MVEKFAKRDEAGVKLPEDPANLNPEGFNMDETKNEEFQKAKETFGKTEITLYCRPLTLDGVSDVQLSGNEMDALGLLLTEK